MGWFTSKSTMEKKSALRNAVAVMLADGKIEPKEIAILGAICARLGLDATVVKEILDKPTKIDFIAPSDDKEKIAQLVDVVFMMMADGNIDQKELDCCRSVAIGFGYNPSIIGKLVLDIAEAIKNGKDREHTIGAAERSLGQ